MEGLGLCWMVRGTVSMGEQWGYVRLFLALRGYEVMVTSDYQRGSY